MAKGQIKQKQATIKKETFEGLCAIQCTKDEICGVLGITDKTLDKWCMENYNENFSVIFAQKRQNGKASLRRTQWKLAEKNVTMAIFLGKNYLDQKDVIEETHGLRNGILDDLVGALNKAKEKKSNNE